MVEGHFVSEQGGQQAAQHRRGLAEGHVLRRRRQRQKGKEKPESMCPCPTKQNKVLFDVSVVYF